jgi:hypothetical protein
MKVLASPAILLVYVVVMAIGVPEFGPVYSPWFLAALSALFVWCYVAVAGGRTVVSFATVFLVTLVFPLGFLVVIGWPVYNSWSVLVSSFVSAFYEHGQLWGLELLLPLVAALATAVSINRRRSNIAVKQSAPQAARPLP